MSSHSTSTSAELDHGLIFVGGIYGSGKTTLCRELSVLMRGQHLSASDLARHKTRGVGDEGKAVDDVEANQQRLLANLADQRAGGLVLLDGHFCLYKGDLEIEDIPLTVFSHIQPILLLLLEVEPATALARLANREQSSFDAARLEHLALRESAHARAVATELGVPLETVAEDVSAIDVLHRVRRRLLG